MSLPVCPGCGMTVIPKSDGACPSCGSPMTVSSSPLSSKQPAAALATKPGQPLPARETLAVEPEYGGFWIRLGAFFVDAILPLPLTLIFFSDILNRREHDVLYVASFIIALFVHVYCVKKWGGSPGKLLCGLKVVTEDLRAVGWKEAWLRHGGNLVLSVASGIVYFWALGQITDSEFSSLGFMDRTRRIMAISGNAQTAITWLTNAWMWSEFIVLLCNSRRRALHDFLAGTVVVRSRSLRLLPPKPSAGMVASS
jgi:uncharacterized RDD family membrane protein YckC